MTTLLYTHPICVEHEPGDQHPERPDRLRAVQAALDGDDFAGLKRREAPRAEVADIENVHEQRYVEDVFENVPGSGRVHLDPDTALSPASGEAALRAAGAVTAAVDAVLGGEAKNAFCAVRPPGHHAESSRAMGFCLFNNVAIAAQRACTKHGLERVAIADFDVHHGNGSQNFVDLHRHLFFASSHQFPCYPGTGAESERGVYENIVNVELAPGSGSEEFRARYRERVLPELRVFAPELLVISAGFDAHARDPLAQVNLGDDDFEWVTRELLEIAEDACEGRVISSLEGGYDLDALSTSVAAHVRVLMAA
jgi:acetoin utilization deacetylase AcuC-like enzyme